MFDRTDGQPLALPFLAPNEHIIGSEADREAITGQLIAVRSTSALWEAHPHVGFSLLSWVPSHANETVQEVFRVGSALMASRYRSHGLTTFLPTSRVWVGTRSTHREAFGGFHFPNQGYRHVQMGALITTYGHLNGRDAAKAEYDALNILRAYLHDCLHFGSFRVYAMGRDGKVYRACYGISPRSADGTSYSRPDGKRARSTRNLGVIMEGATDREAAMIVRETAARLGISEPRSGIDRLAYRDVTGSITHADLRALPRRMKDGVTVKHYRSALKHYARTVNLRYAAFLTKIGGKEAPDLHDLIVPAMISGDPAALKAWLDQRRGGAAFQRLFRSSAYDGVEPGMIV